MTRCSHQQPSGLVMVVQVQVLTLALSVTAYWNSPVSLVLVLPHCVDIVERIRPLA